MNCVEVVIKLLLFIDAVVGVAVAVELSLPLGQRTASASEGRPKNSNSCVFACSPAFHDIMAS